MDIEQTIKLIESFSNSNLDTFEYGEGNLSIKLKNKANSEPYAPVTQDNNIPNYQESQEIIINEIPQSATDENDSIALVKDVDSNNSNSILITSPTVGTFYTSPSPDNDPYIQVGDRVEKGQVIGIVEAMKVMNEIESPSDGIVKEIPTADQAAVEFGETLVVLDRL